MRRIFRELHWDNFLRAAPIFVGTSEGRVGRHRLNMWLLNSIPKPSGRPTGIASCCGASMRFAIPLVRVPERIVWLASLSLYLSPHFFFLFVCIELAGQKSFIQRMFFLLIFKNRFFSQTMKENWWQFEAEGKGGGDKGEGGHLASNTVCCCHIKNLKFDSIRSKILFEKIFPTKNNVATQLFLFFFSVGCECCKI